VAISRRPSAWARAEPGQPGQVEQPAGKAARQQRHDFQLVLPHRLVGDQRGEPHRLQGAAEHLQRHPDVLADLPVGPPRAHRPPPERRRLQEGERQSAGPDRRRDPLHRQPRLLACLGQADLLCVGRQERVGAVAGDQDAEPDQLLDLGRCRAGEVGKFRCRQSLHVAVILGAWPVRAPAAASSRRTRSGRWQRQRTAPRRARIRELVAGERATGTRLHTRRVAAAAGISERCAYEQLGTVRAEGEPS